MSNLSVIIPAYNRAACIIQTIDSVLHQSVSPLEIIVVDDGSTDCTSDLIKSHYNSEIVRCVHQENSGAGAARNFGISLAKGDFIAFLDSDDIWRPQKLEHFFDALAHDPDIGFYYTPTCSMLQPREMHNIQDVELSRRTDKMFLLKSFMTRTSTVIVRKDFAQFPGVAFGTRRTCEDYAFFWRAVILAKKIGFSPYCDTLIRESENSIRKSVTFGKIAEDQFLTIHEVLAWIDENGLDSKFKEPLMELLAWQWKNLLAYDAINRDLKALLTHAQIDILSPSFFYRLRKMLGAAKLVFSKRQREWIRKYAAL